MPLIQRGTISEDFRNGLDLDSVRTGKYVNEASEKVVLTYDYSNARNADIVKGSSAVNATSATIYTTPSDRDFYLTSACLSVIKDITSTSTLTTLLVQVGGQATRVLAIAGITLTPQSECVASNFSTPIKVDRNTNINVTNSTNVANINATAIITGFNLS